MNIFYELNMQKKRNTFFFCILLKINQKAKKKKNFSIISTEQFEIFSIYENINNLSNFVFYKNKSLQMKIKRILEEKPTMMA